MKTKSTVGRLITHFSEWRESGNQKWRESGARVAGTDTATDTATDTGTDTATESAQEAVQETRKRRSTYAARVAAMLLLLCTTALPAWADSGWTWESTINDEGGGEVRYRGETSDHVVTNWSNSYYFKTEKTFNPDNNQFYWEFTVFANYSWQFGVNTGACEYIGEIYVMTADSQAHTIAHWEKSYTSYKDISYSITDSTWGYIYVSQMPNNEITIQYMPTSRAFEDGVKCIMMKENAKETYHFKWAWMQYEKDINCTALKEGYPMPKLSSVSWGTDGSLRGVVTNVPDKRSDSKFKQYYQVYEYYYDGEGESTYEYYTTSGSNVSITEKSGGKMDL